MRSEGVKGYRVILRVEASQPIIEFTGKLVKTLIYALNPELLTLRDLRGVLSPLHISPLFKIKDDYELGDPAYPYAVRKRGERVEIKPSELNGEYVFHVGGASELVDRVVSKLVKISAPLMVKVGEILVMYKAEKVVDITREVFEKADSVTDRVRVYLKSPAQVFNVFTPTKLPKFTPSAIELLQVPYAIANNIYTITETLVLSSFTVLGKLVETWYSLRTLKPVEVIYGGKRQVLIAGYVTYIVQNDKTTIDEIRKVLATAELAGIGRSRQNGFGTTTIK